MPHTKGMVEEVCEQCAQHSKEKTSKHLQPSEFSGSTCKIDNGIPWHKWQHPIPRHQLSLQQRSCHANFSLQKTNAH